ncbi:MAG: hypothetical protein KDE08_10070 [Rhodobacteraceae bacterium]|nr:hypothetical protein [Paracoccaceae bacterium]
MNISRGFLTAGSVYLLVGIFIGIYMGGTQDHSLAPAHAHINLLGFALMTIFGILYRIIPAMADNNLAKAHFWLHQIGALVLVIMLLLLFTGRISEASMVPLAPIAEVMVLLGVASFAYNIFRNA